MRFICLNQLSALQIDESIAAQPEVSVSGA